MRIDRSAVSLFSSHSLVQARSQTEHLTVQRGNPAPRRPLPAPKPAKLLNAPGAAAVSEAKEPLSGLSKEDRVRILLLERVLGIKIRIVRPERSDEAATRTEEPPGTSGPSVAYAVKERYAESEELAFTAQGVIKTADQQEIAFSLSLNLTRTFQTEESLTVRMGEAPKDPLVINYGGPAADLVAGTTFQFDLDNDGRTDLMPLLRQGSGFLALDRNADGTINDGSELFGPASGNGFTELSKYDGDQNHWIDENDPIYQHLRIWTRDAAGQERLFALGELGVGAIFLGAVSAPFSLKDSANQTTALARQMSLYAKADGSGVGTVQQLDVIVK